MGTQKNRLTATILLSTYNKRFEGQTSILEHAKRPLSKALPVGIDLVILIENIVKIIRIAFLLYFTISNKKK